MSQHESGAGSRERQQSSELPAWLESLRPGVRPTPGGNVPSPFNAANLEEEALPMWMRPRRADEDGESSSRSAGSSEARGADKTLSGKANALRPASAAGPNTDESAFGRSFDASSLIDEKSLPSWMRPNDAPAVPSTPPRSIDASSLIEPDAMPSWMKNVQGQPQTSPFAQQTPTAQQMPQTAPKPPVPPVQPQYPQPANRQAPPSPSSERPAQFAQGFSARELIDPQALPGWMTQQDGQQGRADSSLGPMTSLAGSQQGVQQGFSASSLLDPNSLPAWMREGEQKLQSSQSRPTSSPATPAHSSWQAPQAGMQQSGPSWQMPAAPPMPAAPSPNKTIAASSLIEQESLPSWLRPPSGQQATGGYGANGANVRPPRADVRVPSRPRGEVGAQESVAGAANAFASMLGVAAAAPNFPAPPQVQGTQAGQAPNTTNAAPYQSPYAPQNALGTAPYGMNGMSNMNGMPSAAANAAIPPMSAPAPSSPSYPQYPQYAQPQNGYQNGAQGGQMGVNGMNGMPPMQQPAMPGMQNAQNMQPPFMGGSPMSPGAQTGGQSGPWPGGQGKPAKRGLFEAIRNWLSR
jgi:hypothetical protein